MRNRLQIVLVAAGLALGAPPFAIAQETAVVDDVPPPEHDSRFVRALRAMVEHPERRRYQRTVEDQSSLTHDGDGLFLQAGVTLIGQRADRSLTDRDSLLTFAYDIGGAWNPGRAHEHRRDGLSFWIRGGRPVGAPLDANLSEAIGSVLDVNGDLTTDAFYFNELYWALVLGKSFGLVLGRIDVSYHFDFNAVANDPREQFVSDSLVNDPSIPFPTAGTSAEFFWELADDWEFHAAVVQANCKVTQLCIDDLSSDALFFPAEILYTPLIDGLGQGNYRGLAYYNRNGEQRGTGASLSLDQEIGKTFTPFLRLGVAEASASEFSFSGSVGVGLDDLRGVPGEILSIGLTWGDPTADAAGSELLLEAFYRFELNRFLALSPDVQYVIHPARNAVDDHVFVVGFRLQTSFYREKERGQVYVGR